MTGDILRNANGVAVLKYVREASNWEKEPSLHRARFRPTGDVVTADCVERIIRKDMVRRIAKGCAN